MITRLTYLWVPLFVAPFSITIWGKSTLLSTLRVKNYILIVRLLRFVYLLFCHCNFVDFADSCGLRPGFVGDAGLTPCIPTVWRFATADGRAILIFILRQDGQIDLYAGRWKSNYGSSLNWSSGCTRSPDSSSRGTMTNSSRRIGHRQGSICPDNRQQEGRSSCPCNRTSLTGPYSHWRHLWSSRSRNNCQY